MTTVDISKKSIGKFHDITAEIINHQVNGVPTNSLVLKLPDKRPILSTRHGFATAGIIANTQIPPALWDFMHDESKSWQESYSVILKDVIEDAGVPFDEFAFLSTGLNIENTVWAEEIYEDLWVLVFTSAGVKTNAMRIGMDKASGIERGGQFERIGTINHFLFTNARLEEAALASTYITITEAKGIALQDLNIRSAYNPQWQATGTGTDQIIVVSGNGEHCTYVGGHTKIGEMMAKAITRSTKKAITKSARGHLEN